MSPDQRIVLQKILDEKYKNLKLGYDPLTLKQICHLENAIGVVKCSEHLRFVREAIERIEKEEVHPNLEAH